MANTPSGGTKESVAVFTAMSGEMDNKRASAPGHGPKETPAARTAVGGVMSTHAAPDPPGQPSKCGKAGLYMAAAMEILKVTKPAVEARSQNTTPRVK